MFISVGALEQEMKKNLTALDAEAVYENRDSLAAKLGALGMYDLARELSGKSAGSKETYGKAELLARLYAAFGVELYGAVVIQDLSCDRIEFECIYGLTDPATGETGRIITFTVRDRHGRFPVLLAPENIEITFSLDVSESDMWCKVKSCVHDRVGMSTKVTLEAAISGEAFFSEGEFVMNVGVRLAGAIVAGFNIPFAAKNSFPTFFNEEFSGKPLTSLKREQHLAAEPKQVIISKSVIQTRQKSTRIAFDKRRGDGVPFVLCSNGAFKASMATKTSVLITFRLPVFKTIERKLLSSGVTLRFPPETSVWVEWEDVAVVYNLQYKGFLMETSV